MAHSKAQADLGYLHWSEKELVSPFFLVDETPHSQVCLQTEDCQRLSLCDQTITYLAETNQTATSVLWVVHNSYL